MHHSQTPLSPTRFLKPVLVLILFLLPGSALAAPQNVADVSADVAPPPGAYWNPSIPSGSVEIPADQPVLIPAWLAGDTSLISTSEGLGYVQITVTDTQGVTVDGNVTYREDLLAVVWTPTVPFQEGAQYSVSALFENVRMAEEGQYPLFDGDVAGSFQVSVAAPTPAIEPPMILSANIVDYEDYSGSACCPENQVMCDGGICGHCVSYPVSSPSIKLSFTNEVPGAPYVTYKLYLTDESGVLTEHPFNFDLYAEVFDITLYPSGGPEYCVMVEALSLDGTESASEEVCFTDADRMLLDLPGPEAELATCQPAEDVLEPGGMETDVLEPVEGPDGGGNPNQVGDDNAGNGCACSSVRSSSSSPARHWPLGFLAIGLVGVVLGRQRTGSRR